eukprot:SAG25_NODE_2344_length_1697_cov_2.038798_1_plen_67_part_00
MERGLEAVDPGVTQLLVKAGSSRHSVGTADIFHGLPPEAVAQARGRTAVATLLASPVLSSGHRRGL